jgi:hypothetical protein|tara:strand:- start:59 stop:565 length:507 start_codon:yes stop_codon:yes gene_type:complete
MWGCSFKARNNRSIISPFELLLQSKKQKSGGKKKTKKKQVHLVLSFPLSLKKKTCRKGEEERKGNPKKKIPPSFDALRRRWCLVSSREGKKTRIATTREDKNNKNKNNNDDARHRHRNENERNGKHHLFIFFFFFSRLIYPGKSRKKKGVTSDSGKGLGVFGARIARG